MDFRIFRTDGFLEGTRIISFGILRHRLFGPPSGYRRSAAEEGGGRDGINHGGPAGGITKRDDTAPSFGSAGSQGNLNYAIFSVSFYPKVSCLPLNHPKRIENTRPGRHGKTIPSVCRFPFFSIRVEGYEIISGHLVGANSTTTSSVIFSSRFQLQRQRNACKAMLLAIRATVPSVSRSPLRFGVKSRATSHHSVEGLSHRSICSGLSLDAWRKVTGYEPFIRSGSENFTVPSVRRSSPSTFRPEAPGPRSPRPRRSEWYGEWFPPGKPRQYFLPPRS